VTLFAASGLAACSTVGTRNTPIDCNGARTEAAAGKTDQQIADNFNANFDRGEKRTYVTTADVAACRRPEASGNKAAGMISQSY
jgi:hypothetical protein